MTTKIILLLYSQGQQAIKSFQFLASSDKLFKCYVLNTELTIVDPTATPAAVEAICPKSPGLCPETCDGCVATLRVGGRAAGTDLEENEGPGEDERALDLPRGITLN